MTGVTRESTTTDADRPRSDSGEPWDERPKADGGVSTTSAMNKNNNIDLGNYSTMRKDLTYEYDEQELEDGDLPTLSLSRSRSGGVGGGGGGRGINQCTATPTAATPKTLRSPLQDAEIKKQQDFWKQLDAPSSASRASHGDDGPDDEMAFRAEAREDARNSSKASRKGSNSRGRNGNGDYMDQVRGAESEDSDDSRDSKEYVVGENDEVNFCDNTLSAMEAICGENGLQEFCGTHPGTANNKGGDSNNNNNGGAGDGERSRKAKNLNLLTADSVDEHTAIEVEYVEPPQNDSAGLEKERPESWSPTRKNAYLAAMARKAKEDFEKSQVKDSGSVQTKSSKATSAAATDTAQADNTSPEDVYNSLNPAEKRIFLRLINSGMSPTESAQRIRDERSNSNSKKDNTANNNRTAKDTSNNSKTKEGKSKKGKLFKFWKKGSSKSKEKESPKTFPAEAMAATPPPPAVAKPTPTPPPALATAAAPPPTTSPPQEKPRDQAGFPTMEAAHVILAQEEKKEDDRRPIVVEKQEETQVPAVQPRLVQETLSADDESTFEGLSRDPTQESDSQSVTEESQREATASPPMCSRSRSPAVVERSAEGNDNHNDFHDGLEAATTSSSGSVTNEEDDLQVVGMEPSPDKLSIASPGMSSTASPIQQRDSSAASTPRDAHGSAEAPGDVQDISAAIDERFKKSGINYYDAVRRQLSESDDETTFSNSVSSAPAKNKSKSAPRLGPILLGAKLKGFAKLSKGGQKSPTNAPSAVTPDTAAGSDWSYQEQGRLGLVTPSIGGRTDREFSVQDEEKTGVDAHQTPEASSYISPVATPDYSPSVYHRATAASDPSATMLVDEEEVLGRVEKELLRPVTKFTSPVPTALESAFEQKFTPTTDRSHQSEAVATPPATPKHDMDFNMQEYLNSTEVYSQSGYQVSDNMSVVSGTTAETSLYGAGSVFTQSTSMTQSSRKRRPGAAKSRIAKAKEAEKSASKKQGWHESIRAAAQTNNREWKPKLGWVDYQPPDKDIKTADLSTSTVSSEKLHLNLHVGKSPKHADGEASDDGARNDDDNSSFVPFPSEWEKERSAMVKEQTTASPTSQPPASPQRVSPVGNTNHDNFIPPEQTSKTHDHSLAISLDDMSVEQSVAHSVDQFVQSVGASSPARPARKRAVASPSRSARAFQSPSKRSGWVDSMQAATANITDENQSWDPTHGWANIDAVTSAESPASDKFESPSSRYGQTTIEERQNELSDRLDADSSSNDEAVAYSNNALATTRDPANDSADARTKVIVMTLPSRGEGTSAQDSAVKEKYPSKDSKLAKGYTDYGPQIVKRKNVEAPLLNTSRDFLDTPTVDVVKQKVDEEDFNWFPQTRRGSSTVWTEESQPAPQTLAQKSVTSSSKSSRRSRGPVDVDDAENLQDDSEDEASVEWGGVVFETDSPSRNSNVHNTQSRTEASTKSGSSNASLSSFSKLVPTLSKNKRDTSPIRAGRSSEPARGSWAEATASTASPSQGKSLATSTVPMEESRAIQIDAIESKQNSRNAAASPIEYADDESATSSTVRRRLQQWEGRAPRETEPQVDEHPNQTSDPNRLNAATAEWKSFLGKKVRAESAVAAAEPQMNYIGDQDESLFEFSVTEAGTSVGSPSRSKAGAKRLDMSAGQYTYAYDGATGPPQNEGSDFSDGNEINKTFLGRLASCAAPMVPKRIQDGSADALAHLAFLRTNNQQDGKKGSTRFMPPHLCGRPDVILEESEAGQEPTPRSETCTSQSQFTASVRNKGSEVKADTRSVVSEDFGAKTAYLEALAIKTAVSKPRTRSGSHGRGGRSSAASDISSSSTKSHKEKWREFLDKKARAGESPAKIRSNGSDASAAAETYAAKKVEEMMTMMSSRSKSTPRSWRSEDQGDDNNSCVVDSMIREHTASSTTRTVHNLSKKGVGQQQQRGARGSSGRKTDSLVAAEQLASARVNAMMQALAKDSAGVDEGEI